MSGFTAIAFLYKNNNKPFEEYREKQKNKYINKYKNVKLKKR